ncbi:sugar phosphate nucleotidyltransferase, partial [Candidatus Omnitrophota bacterium]
MKSRKCAALVLAAGQGTRMKSSQPKVLHKICGFPLICHIVSVLNKVKVDKKVIVVGFKHEKVKSSLKNNNVRFVLQKQQLGTAHAVLCAKGEFKSFSGDVLVMAGDVPLIDAATLRAFISAHRKKKSKATILTTTVQDPKAYGRIVRNKKHEVIKIVEELDASRVEKEIREINSGLYIFDTKTLFKKIPSIKRNKKKKEFYLTDIVEALIN